MRQILAFSILKRVGKARKIGIFLGILCAFKRGAFCFKFSLDLREHLFKKAAIGLQDAGDFAHAGGMRAGTEGVGGAARLALRRARPGGMGPGAVGSGAGGLGRAAFGGPTLCRGFLFPGLFSLLCEFAKFFVFCDQDEDAQQFLDAGLVVWGGYFLFHLDIIGLYTYIVKRIAL
jgi:hypothetical protein